MLSEWQGPKAQPFSIRAFGALCPQTTAACAKPLGSAERPHRWQGGSPFVRPGMPRTTWGARRHVSDDVAATE